MSKLDDVLQKIDTLEASRKYPDALELAKKSMRDFQNESPLILRMAKLFEINKQFKNAIPIYKMLNDQTLKEGKSDLAVVLSMANCLFHDSQYDDAQKLYSQIYAKVPNHPDVLAGLASLRRHNKQWNESKKLAEQALKIDNDNKVARFELANVHIENKNIDEAIAQLEKNIDREDPHGDSIDLWMKTLDQASRTRYTQDFLEGLADKYPNIIEFIYGFAVLANKAGEITLARPAYEQAMAISPENPRVIYELGVLERVGGDLERSQSLLKKSLEIQPDSPAALRTFMSETRYEYGDDNFKRLNYVAAKFSNFSATEQLHLHYALAKAYEDVDEMDTAFRHYDVAGHKKRESTDYNEHEVAKMNQVVQKVVVKDNLKKSGWVGSNTDVPVFILGMPRSGTSLMEQILSAHPDIFGAGELKFMTGVLENIQLFEGTRLMMGDKDPVFTYDENATWQQRGDTYVERISKLADKPYKRIVDKMPGNFNFVGLIHSILPNAKIIHSRRHPVETCLSCYRIHFAEGHQWTYNLRELGRFYRRYWELMKHWREEFPGVMYEAYYEENVHDVEKQAKNLINYLDLEWNPECLNFYNIDRPVKTASVTQVRKPIYKTSTNRWRKYEQYLGPLLDEIGDIVEEYESEIGHLIIK